MDAMTSRWAVFLRDTASGLSILFYILYILILISRIPFRLLLFYYLDIVD